MLGPPSAALDQRVEAERRQVAFVEDDRMAEIDRPAVVRLVGYQIEQRARTRAVARYHSLNRSGDAAPRV